MRFLHLFISWLVPDAVSWHTAPPTAAIFWQSQPCFQKQSAMPATNSSRCHWTIFVIMRVIGRFGPQCLWLAAQRHLNPSTPRSRWETSTPHWSDAEEVATIIQALFVHPEICDIKCVLKFCVGQTERIDMQSDILRSARTFFGHPARKVFRAHVLTPSFPGACAFGSQDPWNNDLCKAKPTVAFKTQAPRNAQPCPTVNPWTLEPYAPRTSQAPNANKGEMVKSPWALNAPHPATQC